MGLRTGRPRGRPPGSQNKRTQKSLEASKKAAKIIENALPEGAFKGDAHALLMAVYKDPTNDLKDRITAAVAAIGYEKPKFASVTVKGDADNPIVHEHTNADADAFTSRIIGLASKEDKGSGASEVRH